MNMAAVRKFLRFRFDSDE